SKAARGIRNALDSGFGAARRSLDRHGLHTGATGRFVERWHRPLTAAIVLVTIVILLMIRPITATSVFVTVAVVLVLLVVLELVRRTEPAGKPGASGPDGPVEGEGEAPSDAYELQVEAQKSAP
ncbi:MAG: hypothetical protein GX814_10900, partial [Microbacteriaceae bacterium]|nr:hypothetical protein [Microbacteriaceae bacterium]